MSDRNKELREYVKTIGAELAAGDEQPEIVEMIGDEIERRINKVVSRLLWRVFAWVAFFCAIQWAHHRFW